MTYAFYTWNNAAGCGNWFAELEGARDWCEAGIGENRDAAIDKGEWSLEADHIYIFRVPLGADDPLEDGELVAQAKLVQCPDEPDGYLECELQQVAFTCEVLA